MILWSKGLAFLWLVSMKSEKDVMRESIFCLLV
jgi:hypothetical protein